VLSTRSRIQTPCAVSPIGILPLARQSNVRRDHRVRQTIGTRRAPSPASDAHLPRSAWQWSNVSADAPMADIFLSYAREDETRARALADALELRGWSIFWDRRIPHGRNFRNHIEDQLGSARCIVVLWSKASLASQFVLDEPTEGQNDGRLVPALIEAVRQPLGFRGLQAANLADWTGTETPTTSSSGLSVQSERLFLLSRAPFPRHR
jgi:hypothetical protein